jgi:hypothetical protein
MANGKPETAIGGLSFRDRLHYFERKMFLQLNHQQFDIYRATRILVKEFYLAAKGFPQEEKFVLIQQIGVPLYRLI